MIVYPNAKINLGLNILRKRDDGYHDLDTVFIPLLPEYGYNGDMVDRLEINLREDKEVTLKIWGTEQTWEKEQDLCVKAYRELARHYDLPGIDIKLTKKIPSGAGLGGGSSDAAFTLSALNEMLSLGIDENTLAGYAANFGSDTAFFIYNRPMHACGRGELLTDIANPLPEGCTVGIVTPDIHISTAEAFSGVSPSVPEIGINEILKRPCTEWKDLLHNDFEDSIFPKHKILEQVKKSLYEAGALYASMSGSGSAMYGIFQANL